ncbi:hypothetical protein QJQ45_007475 [Haematococcus lacustris]|nr:hypothetical protein QJQ45_007475 [Haematococcus lacustris]
MWFSDPGTQPSWVLLSHDTEADAGLVLWRGRWTVPTAASSPSCDGEKPDPPAEIASTSAHRLCEWDPHAPQPKEERQAKRKRDKARKHAKLAAAEGMHVQEQLDRLHPGNVRNRQAAQLVTAAFESLTTALAMQPGCQTVIPGVSAALQPAPQPGSEHSQGGEQQQGQQAPSPGRRCSHQPDIQHMLRPKVQGCLLPIPSSHPATVTPSSHPVPVTPPSHPATITLEAEALQGQHQATFQPLPASPWPAGPGCCEIVGGSALAAALLARCSTVATIPVPAAGFGPVDGAGAAATAASPTAAAATAGDKHSKLPYPTCSPPPLPDWVALHPLRHVLRPKITLPITPQDDSCGPSLPHAPPLLASTGSSTTSNSSSSPDHTEALLTASPPSLGVPPASQLPVPAAGVQRQQQQQQQHLPPQPQWRHQQHEGARQPLPQHEGAEQQQQQQQQQQPREDCDLVRLNHHSSGLGLGVASQRCLPLYDHLVANPSDQELLALAHQWPVLLPPCSRFLMADLTASRTWATLQQGRPPEGYRLLVADPPWENASVKRSAAYPALPARQLLRLPLKELLHQVGSLTTKAPACTLPASLMHTQQPLCAQRCTQRCTQPAQQQAAGSAAGGWRLGQKSDPVRVRDTEQSAMQESQELTVDGRLCAAVTALDAVVLLWITNREKLHRFVAEELLAAWGLTHCTTWYWLKLGSGGHAPISSLASMHRHPFEHLLVLRPSGRCVDGQDASGTRTEHMRPGLCQPSCGDDAEWQPSADRLPRSLVIMSCPAEHSRKPHLGRLIARLLPSHGAMGQLQPGILPARPLNLELFARDMHAGWDAVGNEVLTFQRAELFYPV